MKDPKHWDASALQSAINLEKGLQFPEARMAYGRLANDSSIAREVRYQALFKLVSIQLLYQDLDEASSCLDSLDDLDVPEWVLAEKLIFRSGPNFPYSRDQKLRYLDIASKLCEENPKDCAHLTGKLLLQKSRQMSISQREELIVKALQQAKRSNDVDLELEALLWLCTIKEDSETEKRYEQIEDLILSSYEYPQYGMVKLNTFRAGHYLNQSEYQKSIDTALQIVDIYRVMEDRIPGYYLLYACNYLGYCFNKIGDYFEAIYYTQKALTLQGRQASKERRNSCLILAHIYRAIGRTDLGIKYAKLALEYFKQVRPDWASNPAGSELHSVYLTLGYSYEPIDKQVSAEYYQKALQFIEETEKDPTLVPNYGHLRERMVVVLPNAEGLEYARSALPLLTEKYQVYEGMGDAHYEMGDFAAAKASYLKAIIDNLTGEGSFSYDDIEQQQYNFENYLHAFEVILKLGQLHFQMYRKSSDEIQLHESIAYYRYALDIQELMKRSIDDQSQIVINDGLPNRIGSFVKALLQQTELDYNLIIRLFEICKANILHQSLIEKQLQRKYRHFPFFEKEQNLKSEIRKLEQAWKQASNESEKNACFNRFFDKRRAHQELIRSLQQDYPAYSNARYEQASPSMDTIKSALKAEEKVISYLLLDEEILILFISREDTEVVCFPKPANLSDIIREYLASISSLNTMRVQQLATQLYQILIAPISDLLFGILDSHQFSDLTIIPHQELASLPFEALFIDQSEEGADYLINHFDIAYHYSIGLWLGSKEKQIPEHLDGFLGLAPVYDRLSAEAASQAIYDRNSDKKNWQALPYSKKEVEGIAALFEAKDEDSKLLIREEAIKSALLTHISQYRYVHLAAHFHQHDIPQRSGLVLADSNYLFVDDTYALDLKAELVVLSACESGIGELSNSEGMLAISRGLQYAGVQNVVTTLFKINDKLAYELMHLFYVEILKGHSIRAALNTAKRTLSKSEHTTEAIWASFTLIGE